MDIDWKSLMAEEESDVKKYTQISKELKDSGHVRYANIVRDIAYEESIHAEMLLYIEDKLNKGE